jgi:hypothetical protein
MHYQYQQATSYSDNCNWKSVSPAIIEQVQNTAKKCFKQTHTPLQICILVVSVLLQQDKQYTNNRSNEARSCNQYCCGKAVSITYSQCVFVCLCSLSFPACKAHAQYYIVICGLSGFTIFFHIIS